MVRVKISAVRSGITNHSIDLYGSLCEKVVLVYALIICINEYVSHFYELPISTPWFVKDSIHIRTTFNYFTFKS